MASTMSKSNKRMTRLQSKKSYSWWWDSHISPKNSKWLQENLEEMDQNVKRMLKLIEEDADSFAKRAEMYYQKRPELISLVEEFYRMYRSLAERYDNVTGELKRSIPSDLQSQGSGISEVISEPSSTMTSPDRRPSRRSSGHRAAGFDFFLGAAGNGMDNKEGDDSSTLDSESDSDDSSVHNYTGTQSNDEDQGLQRRIIELEIELRDVKEKLRMHQEEVSEGSLAKYDNENTEILLAKIVAYEEELRLATERIKSSEEEINHLTNELQNYKSLENKLHDSEEEVVRLKQEVLSNGLSIQHLEDQLKSAQNEISEMKAELEREKSEVSKLEGLIERYKSDLVERDEEIKALKEAMLNENKSLSDENEQLKAETTRVSKERNFLVDNLKELDLRCQSLEENVRSLMDEKEEMEVQLRAKMERLEESNKLYDTLKLKYNLMSEKHDDLKAKIAEHSAEMDSKDDQIDQMNKHLHQLHMEHVELIVAADEARKVAQELRSRVKDLEKEVEKKQKLIQDGAEEKREAIRQLCFSLEHYRNGYHRLRQAVIVQKRLPILAS